MALALQVDTLDGVDESVQTLYVEKDGKFVLDVDGLPDTKGLKSALDKEREAARNAKKVADDLKKQFEGIDPDKYRQTMARFENDKEAALIAEGKIDEVVKMRTEKMQNDVQKQLDEANKRVETASEKAKKYSGKVLDNHILAAASKAGLHKHAVDDALYRGRNMFSLDEDGNAVQLGADGKPVYGKNGKDLFSVEEWLEGSKEWAPHWHPSGASGGGAGGGDGSGATGKTIKRSELMAMSPEAQRKATVVDKIKVVDD